MDWLLVLLCNESGDRVYCPRICLYTVNSTRSVSRGPFLNGVGIITVRVCLVKAETMG